MATFWDIYNRAPPTLRGAAAVGVWLILYRFLPGIAVLALAGVSLWFLRGRQRLLVLFVIAAFWGLQSCGFTSLATIRYRLAFDVEMNGEVKSGSSIVEVAYSYYGNASGRSTINRARRGVAAIIDLGDRGTLVAALGPNNYGSAVWSRRKKQFGLSCREPKGTKELFDAAYGLDPQGEYDNTYFAKVKLLLLTGGRKLTDDNLPVFIWFPRGAPYRQAQQLCPEEFPRVIGADVRLRSASIEPAPWAPVQVRLDIAAPWLEEMRNDKNHGSFTGFGDAIPTWPYLPAQIESCSHPDVSRCYEWS